MVRVACWSEVAADTLCGGHIASSGLQTARCHINTFPSNAVLRDSCSVHRGPNFFCVLLCFVIVSCHIVVCRGTLLDARFF